jgi:hypothetical protein
MHLHRLTIVTLAFGGLALLPIAAKAQSGFGTRPTVGIFGGVTIPSGPFSNQVKFGAHAGGLASLRLYQQLDARIDGAWNKFGEKKIDATTFQLETYATVIYGTLNAVLNVGPDSAAYPGDNSVSPYILAGAGAYRLDYDEECSGACGDFVQSGPKTYFGMNLGVGTNATFGPLKPFIEGRYHRISRSAANGGTRSMYTISVGLKLR